MRRALSVLVLLLVAGAAIAGAPSGDAIVAAIRRQFAVVNDYRADVSLSVKGPKISINNMSMTVYFKKPNKIHVDATQGLAMIPSRNFFGDPLREIVSSGHATYLRTEKKLGRECYVLNLASAHPGMLLWVDKQQSVIVAMEGQGGFKTSWRYEKIDGKYYMPVEICADTLGPMSSDTKQPTKATIKFSNYRINKGISDSVFHEKDRK